MRQIVHYKTYRHPNVACGYNAKKVYHTIMTHDVTCKKCKHILKKHGGY